VGYAQGVVPGGTFLPMPPGSEGYHLSVAMGQLAGSVYDIIAGSGLAVGGGALTVTVLGAPVGVPAAAVGGGLVVAGGVNAANAIGNIVKIGGGDDPPQGTEERTSVERFLEGATPTHASKPGMGSEKFEMPGGLDAANADFNGLTNGLPVASYPNGIRSVTLPNGSTVSVRPSSGQGSPTIQINPPTGNPIKVRYQ
jgi:hypothetical protein